MVPLQSKTTALMLSVRELSKNLRKLRETTTSTASLPPPRHCKRFIFPPLLSSTQASLARKLDLIFDKRQPSDWFLSLQRVASPTVKLFKREITIVESLEDMGNMGMHPWSVCDATEGRKGRPSPVIDTGGCVAGPLQRCSRVSPWPVCFSLNMRTLLQPR